MTRASINPPRDRGTIKVRNMQADRGFTLMPDAAAPMSLELPVSTRTPYRPRGSERELPPATFPCRAVTAILHRFLCPCPQWLSGPCVGRSRQTERYFYPANGSCHPWLQPEGKKPAGREQSLTTHQPELLLPAVCHPSVTGPGEPWLLYLGLHW